MEHAYLFVRIHYLIMEEYANYVLDNVKLARANLFAHHAKMVILIKVIAMQLVTLENLLLHNINAKIVLPPVQVVFQVLQLVQDVISENSFI